jgi:hypothetical protein
MKKFFLVIIVLCGVSMADLVRDADTKIVTDTGTALQWQDGSIGETSSWKVAIENCESLTFGGYDDWRLPNFNELKAIVDISGKGINNAFKYTAGAPYWSSTSYAPNKSYAWTYLYWNGFSNISSKFDSYYTRCVRAGQ